MKKEERKGKKGERGGRLALLAFLIFLFSLLICGCASSSGKEALMPPEPYVFPDNVPQSGHNPGSYGTVKCTYSPDGSRFVTAFENEMKIWDSETYRVQVVIQAEHNVYRLKWSNDGRYILSSSAEVWDSYTGQQITSLTTTSRYRHDAVALSGDGKYILVHGLDTGLDGTGHMPILIIKNIATGETKQDRGTSYFRSITTGPAGTDMVLIGTQGNISLYSARRGQVGDSFSSDFAINQFRPKDAAFSPDGKYFVVSVETYTGDVDITAGQKAFLYNRTNKKPISNFRIFTGNISQMRFSPDGKQLFVYSDNNEVNIFDVASGQQVDVIDQSELVKQTTRK